jgi:hypothetical protein
MIALLVSAIRDWRERRRAQALHREQLRRIINAPFRPATSGNGLRVDWDESYADRDGVRMPEKATRLP